MKKILCLSALSIMMTFNASAENTGPGCGLGAQLFDGQSGLGPHILAATTNGSSANQTFGMSTGTFGCEVDQKINYQASVFVNENIQQIAVDFSRGQGETLDSLVNLLGVAEQDKDLFASVVRSNFADIFSSEKINAQGVLDNLAAVMRDNEKLSAYVS